VTDRRPKWRQVADDLRAQISSGTPGPGERLPAETELAEQYGVGRGTIRTALDILEGEGLLTPWSETGQLSTCLCAGQALPYRSATGPGVRQSRQPA
jgi:DNA-binding GntR family transcriptional regulator